YGTVYVAYNREIKKLCAVKELKDVFKLENGESIRKEIKILSQLEHPNIVKYFGNEIAGHHISLYMEYIKPGSLKKYISERGILCEPL
ncbi:mitogen-activated protein kinase kinase kinase 3, partial [Neltuma alba]